ncbi:hypothetical protein TNCT_394241 [Trichonephila clavata]|uniref:Uncharacterized protein n=1 Tax=Trichonephila clavata TaxID=2740835 RepID=A0A8X6IX01_TRICU|nr:hypothetical protein TNCT_394241 [Trichonephila clavata]
MYPRLWRKRRECVPFKLLESLRNVTSKDRQALKAPQYTSIELQQHIQDTSWMISNRPEPLSSNCKPFPYSSHRQTVINPTAPKFVFEMVSGKFMYKT